MNPLLSGLDALFSILAELQDNFNQPNYALPVFRSKVIQALKRFEQHALDNLLDKEQIYKLQYALAACIDEWVIHSAAGQHSSWLSNPLQLELFGDSHAGEQFFNDLATLRLQAEKYIDVLEIFYLCLELGYQGHYRLSKKSALYQLKCELLSQIQQVRKRKDLKLSPAIQSLPRLQEKTTKNYFKKAAVAAAVVIVVLNLSLWTTISIKAQQYRQHLLSVLNFPQH